jgi:hypothetical protein
MNSKDLKDKARGWAAKLWTLSRRTLIVLGILAVVLIGLRIALPHIVLHYVNGVLGGMPDYRGSVAEVDIHLWRGAYQIHALKLEKRTDKRTYAPFIDAPVIDFSMEWKALILHGSFVGEVEFERPVINFVDAPTKEQSQLGLDESWGDRFEKLFPFQINRLRIRDGTLFFRNPASDPPVNLEARQLQVYGVNLNNSGHSKERRPSRVDITAHVLKTGTLKSRLEISPVAKRPDFHLTVELKHVSLPEMNNFLKAYALVDAESGRFEMFAEIDTVDGKIDGYVKPIIEDLKLVDLKDLGKNPFQVIWEGIVSAVSFIFTNHSKDTVATKIPFSGTIDDPDPDWFALLGGLLKNAYIRHIFPGLDKDVSEPPPASKPPEKKPDA